MYLIYIDASEEKMKENGMTSETFWETIKVNFEENGFMPVEGAPQYFAEWTKNKTLEPFADDDVTIEINASYLDNMLHELDLIKKHGKRKSKPVNFKHLDD